MAADPENTGPDNSGPDKDEPDNPAPDDADPGNTGQDDAEEGAGSDSAGPGEADPPKAGAGPDDIDSEFYRMVAGLDLKAPETGFDEPRSSGGKAEPSPDDLPPTSGPVFQPLFSDPVGPTEDEEDEDGDEHFVPPEPTPDRMRPLTAVAWGGAVGGPAFIVLMTIFDWYIPSGIATLVIGGFIAGVVYLIVMASRDPDDWDDGAAL